MTYQPQNRNLNTGVYSGCVLSINVDTTKFDLSAGVILIEDYSVHGEGRLKEFSYPGQTGITPPDPFNTLFTKLSLIPSATDGVAELEMTAEGTYDATTRRTEVALPIVFHLNGDGILGGFSDDNQYSYGWLQALNDMNHCRGNCNDGNVITPNGVNLSFDKSAGSTGMLFFNSINSPWLNPSVRSNPAQSPVTFVYQAQDPAGPFVGNFRTTIDSANWDNNGVIEALPGGANIWTIQRCWNFGQSDTFSVSYGQTTYTTKEDAEKAVATEIFVDPVNTRDAYMVAFLIIKKNTTDLSDTTENTIIRN